MEVFELDEEEEVEVVLASHSKLLLSSMEEALGERGLWLGGSKRN